MGRPAGSRNPDFEATREQLARSALARLMEPGGAGASLRELAAAAGVSVATMRHYFGGREGVVAAALARAHGDGLRYLVEVATGPLDPLPRSLGWLLAQVIEGFRRGPLSRLHALGLAAGLGDAALGPAYVNELLEPTLKAAEARLARHVAAGELAPCDLRHAALALLGPLLLALLHQGPLGGRVCRPLDLDAFAATHLDAFLRAFSAKVPPAAQT
ncbi:TetR/AcrR family transcriptional regulator [Sorangium sp. So ce321]|uniref:TetR/AcrR family transcriptional regulator n=1 Tax=Sorangium sp. So ce321 TaxID=3133300 RepID=UPI003F6340DC